MADNAAAFVGDIPHFYDIGLGPVLFEPYAEELADIAAAFSPRSVLELAAGTGISAAALARRLTLADLVVTDLNAPMLEIATAKLPAAVEVQPADAQDLPFEDAAFDLVACQFGVMFLPDLAAGFREAARVLRPTGTYCFSVWDSHAHNWWAATTDAVVTRPFPDDPPPFYRVPFHLSDVHALRELLHECGFGRVTIEISPRDTRVESWETFASGLIRGNPVSGQIIERGGDVHEFEREVVAAFSERYGNAPTTIPIQAIFVVAQLKD